MNIINISRLFQSEIEKSGENVTTQPIKEQNIDQPTKDFMKYINNNSTVSIGPKYQDKIKSHTQMLALDASRQRMTDSVGKLEIEERTNILRKKYDNYFYNYFNGLDEKKKKDFRKIKSCLITKKNKIVISC